MPERAAVPDNKSRPRARIRTVNTAWGCGEVDCGGLKAYTIPDARKSSSSGKQVKTACKDPDGEHGLRVRRENLGNRKVC